MEQRVNPCRQDCPNRTATCHASCQEYREYWQTNQEEYARRARENAVREADVQRGKKIRRDVRQRGLDGTRRRG